MSVLKLELERVFNAPRQLVFDTWTSEEALKQWHCGTVTDVKMQLEVGGEFMIRFEPSEECDNQIVRGSYLAVERPERLQYSWKWEGAGSEDTVVTIDFVEQGEDVTLMRLVHEKFETEQSRDNHLGGWTECLESLKEFLPTAQVK